MTQNEAKLNEAHSGLVSRLAKNPHELLRELNADKVDVWHMATGVATEAGELLTAAKAYSVYGKGVDYENVVEELGDLEFYLEGLRQTLNISRAETLSHNIEKLTKRYGQTYSNDAAIARVDKESER